MMSAQYSAGILLSRGAAISRPVIIPLLPVGLASKFGRSRAYNTCPWPPLQTHALNPSACNFASSTNALGSAPAFPRYEQRRRFFSTGTSRDKGKTQSDAKNVTPTSSSHNADANETERIAALAAKRILAPHLFGYVADEQRPFRLFRKLVRRWRIILQQLLPLGGASEKNKVDVYSNGDDAFRAMWEEIDKANERVCIETFILHSDKVGEETVKRLTNAAKRGCEVTLVIDGAGSYQLQYVKPWFLAELLQQPTARCIVYNPLLQWPWSRKPGHGLWHRNHRKILVVDDRVGFAGGLNMSCEYAGPELGDSKAKSFRDTHLRVEGPAVAHLYQVFLDTVESASEIDHPQGFPKWFRDLKTWSNRAVVRIKGRYNRVYNTLLEGSPDHPPAVNRLWQRQMAKVKRRLSEAKSKAKRSAASVGTRAVGDPQFEAGHRRRLASKTAAPVVDANAQTSHTANAKADVNVEQKPAETLTDADTDETEQSTQTQTAEQLAAEQGMPAKHASEGVFVQVLPLNYLRDKIGVLRALVQTVNYCGHNIWITNPFLVPPKAIVTALVSAAQRGVDVRIITSGRSDTPYMRWAATHIYHRFLQRGVRIFEYQPKVLHAKTTTIDGLFCSIGSFNLDVMSAFRLLEVNISMVDRKTARALEVQFERDLKDCREITIDMLSRRTVFERFLHWVTYQIGRMFLFVWLKGKEDLI